jgi:uncharacterized protein
MTPLLALAAFSARLLAESARDGGYRPVALDLFGDADTRRAAQAWWPIGAPAALAIDADALLAALQRLRGQGAIGWIAGSGFEGRAELLAAGERLLPLLGNAPAVVAAVRDPAVFFGRLTALGIPHPPSTVVPPSMPTGWLRKNFASSGGWAVRLAGRRLPGEAATYYQRIAAGQPMSALFLADGRRARLLGVNLQIARRLGGRPYVFRGCIGPLPVAPGLCRELAGLLDALSADFGLRGLNSLDFLLDAERPAVLELNPRPSASMALYRDALPGGLLRAHVAASREARLPAAGDVASGPLRGFEVVFARRRQRVVEAGALAMAQNAWCHDLPAAGARLAWGEPVCTVSAAGGTVGEVQAQLVRRRRQIPYLLEQIDERSGKESRVPEPECQ